MLIGFIGAGIMGQGMAENLLQAGHSLTVIAHRNRAPIDALVSRGAQEADSVTALAREVDVVVLCLPGTHVVRAVIDDMAPVLKPGAMVIDTTTNQPGGPEAFEGQLAKSECHYVEAPVTGGVRQATEGKLGAIVGCTEADFSRATEVLYAFCSEVERFGAVGMAVQAKLVSNLLALGTATLVVESFRHARALGIDWEKLYRLAQLGSGNSSALRRILDAALNEDFGGYVFSIENTAKDFDYLCKLGGEDGAAPELATLLSSIYQRAVAGGQGKRMLSERLDPSFPEP